MEQNTLSLLNSPWMIEAGHKASMYPYLLSMIRGDFSDVKPMAAHPLIYMSWDEEDEEFDRSEETRSDAKYIAVLSIKTPIFKYNQYCGPRGVKSMMDQMKEWEGNDNVMGVVLDIDSGGGQASGLYDFAKFINNYSKPVVSFTDGYMCSAAYYIGAAAKGGIIASEGADFLGSIGTMLTYVDLTGILIKDGAVIKDIYAEGSPKKNKASRAMDDNGDEQPLIKEILNPYRDSFVASIESFRPGINKAVFDGDVYLPADALEMKLVDSLGTISDAFNKVIEMASPQKSSKNSNRNTMSKTKSLPLLQAVLGLTGDVKISRKLSGATGMFFTEAQLDALEAAYASRDAAVTTANGQVTAANGKVTALETAVNTAVTAAGLDADVQANATTETKLTLLSYKVVEYGKQPASGTTAPKSKGDTFEEEDDDNKSSIYNEITS